MEHPCGIRADRPADTTSRLEKLIRAIAFSGLVLLAGILAAGVILLPRYARLQRLEYRRQCESLRVREARETVAAMDRLCEAARHDDVLIQRLAWSRLGLVPLNTGRVVTENRSSRDLPPGELTPLRYENPPRPNVRLMAMATLLDTPRRRNAMLLMAAGMVVTACICFGPIRQGG
jgi:hypothetical protein